MATHSSILACRILWTKELGGLQSMGSHDQACVHEGGGWQVGSNKLVELKQKQKQKSSLISNAELVYQYLISDENIAAFQANLVPMIWD